MWISTLSPLNNMGGKKQFIKNSDPIEACPFIFSTGQERQVCKGFRGVRSMEVTGFHGSSSWSGGWCLSDRTQDIPGWELVLAGMFCSRESAFLFQTPLSCWKFLLIAALLHPRHFGHLFPSRKACYSRHLLGPCLSNGPSPLLSVSRFFELLSGLCFL